MNSNKQDTNSGGRTMIGNSKKILAVLLVGMFLAGGTAHAKGPFTKFGRGMTNILLAPLELVAQPVNMAEDNNVVVSILGGVPKGIVFIPVRIALGVYDVATFFVPYPKDFGYWMEPETVLEGMNAETKKVS